MANGKKNGKTNGTKKKMGGVRPPSIPKTKFSRQEKSVRLTELGERIIKPKGVTKPKPTTNTTPVRKVKPKTNTQKLREAKKTLKYVKRNRKLEKKIIKSERDAGQKLSRINNKIRKQTNRRLRTARRVK